MSYKQQAVELAQRLSAEVESGGSGTDFEITIDAPKGFHWASDGVHSMVESIWDDQRPEHLWRSALERMGHGLAPCDPSDAQCRECA